MLKIVIATALIFLAGGAWLSLDYLNKQEQAHAKEMHQGIVQARLEATKRVQTQANFESLIRANQSNCDAAAEKSQNEYMSIMQKAIPSKKKGQSVIPQGILDESAKILASTKVECQKISTAQLQKGL